MLFKAIFFCRNSDSSSDKNIKFHKLYPRV